MDVEPNPSPALSKLPADLRLEYDYLLADIRQEIRPVSGITAITNLLLERYVFLYVALRHQERDFQNLDQQRYNQLHDIWLKVAERLLSKIVDVYKDGALSELFTDKVMMIVVEEIKDLSGGPEALGRIRARITSAMKDP